MERRREMEGGDALPPTVGSRLMQAQFVSSCPSTPREPFMPSPRKRVVRPAAQVLRQAAASVRATGGVPSPLAKSPPPARAAWADAPPPLSESTAAANGVRRTPAGPRAVRRASPVKSPATPQRPGTSLGVARVRAMPRCPDVVDDERPSKVLRADPPRPGTSLGLCASSAASAPARDAEAADLLHRPGTSLGVHGTPVSTPPPVRPRVRMAALPAAAAPVRSVRAKLTDGVATRPRASPRTGCEVPPRGRRAGAPAPAPPSPSSCIDVAAVALEIGENSFCLGDEPAGDDTVQVHVRLRPTSDGEECAWVAAPESASVALDARIAATKLQASGGPFYFDGVHTGSSNADVYATLARPLVQSLLHGYNAVIFAYGQTASGKTFTLSGDAARGEAGVIARAVHDVFHGICQVPDREFLLRVSYLEIWNEIVKDLLEPSNVPQVRDDRRRGVSVAPLHEAVVTSPAQVFQLLARGEANRHVGATDWNERSSRSHTCLKFTLESWARTPGAKRPYRVSELCLIDLAGSERHTLHASGRREGGNINKSLLSLGKVIYALSDRGAHAHVPFRDSKLTRILQNSLSGNARVAVVCTLNPSPAMVEESLGTLSFARRIKGVAVQAQCNEFEADVDAGTMALLARYRQEMEALRAKVGDLEGGTPSDASRGAQPPAQPSAARPVTLQSLHARLDELGALILPGGQARAPHPVSPAKQRGFAFDDPLPVVQEKLHAALLKISRLERKLATRLSIPAATRADDAAKDRLIHELTRQVRELETVCEAQLLDAPPKDRADVEHEWRARLEAAQAETRARDAFVDELRAECARLRHANEALVRLAHEQTASMATQLAPAAPMFLLFAPHLRPPALAAPPAPGRPPSIDESDSELSDSSVDALLDASL